jgi:hypothetical protein
VVLAFLIRSDGDGTRQPMGDYVANQLESVGFTVDRQYKTSSEAAPIWIGSIASEGLWNLYTAGWLPSGLTRDERSQIQQMYLNTSVRCRSFSTAPMNNSSSGDDLAQGDSPLPKAQADDAAGTELR